MDPLVHLRIHDQAHTSFERSVRSGRAVQRPHHGDATEDVTTLSGRPGALPKLARLLHLRHA